MIDVSPQYLDGYRAAVVIGVREGNRRGVFAREPERVQRPETVASVPLPAPSREERIKKDLHPLDAYPRLLDCVNSNRPPGPDDRFRFQWFGLFYQGPRQDAFVLRLRLAGGRLPAFQLSGLAEIAQHFGSGYVVCNPQGGLDVPGIPVREAIEVLRCATEAGFRSLLAGGDCVQAVRGGEYEDADHSVTPAVYPLVRELEQALAMNRLLSDLPGSCEVMIQGPDGSRGKRAQGAVGPGVISIRCLPAARGTGELPDSNDDCTVSLTVPGAASLHVGLTVAQVVPACVELLGRWAIHGDRSDRQRARLAVFCSEIGYERVCEWLEGLVRPLQAITHEPSAIPARLDADPVGVPVPGGLLLSATLDRLAVEAARRGSGELRLAGSKLFFANSDDGNATEETLRDVLHPR